MATVFIVGTGRSGTTALYEFLCSHEDAVWISNYSQRLSLASLFHPRGTSAGKHRDRQFWTVRPVEGYALYRRRFRLNADGMPSLRRSSDVQRLRRDVDVHTMRARYSNHGAVFVSKNTGNTRAISLLDEVFPEARYIHLVRHPYNVVSSLIKVDFFNSLIAYWQVERPQFANAIATGQSPVRLAAELWSWETRICLDSLGEIAPGRVMRLSYERLTTAPAEALRDVLAFCDLQAANDTSLNERIAELKRPFGLPSDLDEDDLNTIWDICGPLATDLGYQRYEDRNGR